jgi:hypothetical protein
MTWLEEEGISSCGKAPKSPSPKEKKEVKKVRGVFSLGCYAMLP